MNLRFFEELEGAETVLVAGMGGGYDVFAGIPLYFALRERGKRVHLANLLFSMLYASFAHSIKTTALSFSLKQKVSRRERLLV